MLNIDINQLLESAIREKMEGSKSINPRRTFLTLNSMLSAEPGSMKGLQLDYTRRQSVKHTISAQQGELQPPLNETSFFIDCTLDPAIINASIGIGQCFMSVIPNRPTLNENVSQGFVVGIDDSATGIPQDYPCDPAPISNDGIESCKLQSPLGRYQIATKTAELDQLIRKACRGVYEDFYFVGDVRGVSARPESAFTRNDRDLIIEGSLMKAMSLVGRNIQRWWCSNFWTGDPTDVLVNGANGGTRSPLGLLELLSGDYPTDLAAYLTSTAGADCSLLNTDVKDFGSECIGGGVNSIYEYMLEADHTTMMKASLNGLSRDELWIVMPTVLFRAWYEAIPCEMVAFGCDGATALPNDGGGGLFNLAKQDELRNQRVITLNGNTYRIFLDDHLPVNNPLPGEYEGSIIGIPVVVSGEEVLYTENIDYREMENQLQPIEGLWSESVGWTDGGLYLHTVERKTYCFQVNTKVEPRVVFKAPHLAWRIDNVKACYLQEKPLADTL